MFRVSPTTADPCLLSGSLHRLRIAVYSLGRTLASANAPQRERGSLTAAPAASARHCARESGFLLTPVSGARIEGVMHRSKI